MQVSGHFHASAALNPGKKPLVPIGLEDGWAPGPVWTRWWREKFSAPRGTRTPARSPALFHWAIPTSHIRICTDIMSEKTAVCQVSSKCWNWSSTGYRGRTPNLGRCHILLTNTWQWKGENMLFVNCRTLYLRPDKLHNFNYSAMYFAGLNLTEHHWG
jgi:hypothetical protein